MKTRNDSSVCEDTKMTCNDACAPDFSACGERCQASFEECEWLAKFGRPQSAEHAAQEAEMRARREADVAEAEQRDAERLARDQKHRPVTSTPGRST